ncbi:unnamed protein product [Somion occarium]|uniref:C3H1-type domain-containing protein n=1 Tax=Somion occarium TaxID=3059160 RepID=A0ABP1DU51_9APHY
MAYGLTIGTERATALQNAIQDELTKRGYSPDADPVMAEYITIMIINNKTAAQISSELEDLIGSDFDPSFVDWLFAEVEKSAPEEEAPAPPEPIPLISTPSREAPPHVQSDLARRTPQAPRAPLYQQAISQLPLISPNDRKRTRSTSPGHAAKVRRTDLPTGPRAMYRDGHEPIAGGSRSLLDRVGPRNASHGNFPRENQARIDTIQARIDNITNAPSPDMAAMMMNAGFPMNGMPPMDMNAMASMTNPLMLQEMMMNQMALMSQMAGALGMMSPGAPFMNGGFPMQPAMGGDATAFAAGPNGQQMGGMDRGRGRGRGGAVGRGRGRGGQPSGGFAPSNGTETTGAALAPLTTAEPTAAPVAAPTPTPATFTPATAAAPAITPSQSRSGFVPPERPQSPTLCKFGLKCTNPLCRWSHPSPVATPESGVVLSNEPCENGKNCKDKDCVKAHVSPAVLKPAGRVNFSLQVVHLLISLNPAPEHLKPAHYTPPGPHQTACRFGTACTRPNCPYQHPPRPSAQPCRFGAGCTRANCTFQHPEGRVLPTSFHRGLSTTGGLVTVSTPETGTIGAPSPHKSVKFTRTPSSGGTSAAELEKRVKEMEEKKSQAEAAVAQAEAAAAAAGKKDDENKPVSITA